MATVQEPRRRGLLPGAVQHARCRCAQVIRLLRREPPHLRADVRRHGHQGHVEFRQRRVAARDVSAHARVGAGRRPRCGSAVIGLIVAPLGLLTGSWLAERLRATRPRRRQPARAADRHAGWCCRFRWPFRWRRHPKLALGLWAMNFFCAMLGVGPANAAVQMITPNQMRGQMRAAYQFVFNVVGFGAGPFLVGAVHRLRVRRRRRVALFAGHGRCHHRSSWRRSSPGTA